MSVLIEKNGAVTTVILNRPEVRNAVDGPTAQALADAFREFDADDESRVAVFWGRGGTFCAGADLKGLDALSSGERDNSRDAELDSTPGDPEMSDSFHGTYTYLASVRKPIIAAINGPCAGMAIPISLFCDMRFASDRATFTTAFSRRGLIAEWGVSWILPRLVGPAHAMDLLFSARKFDAAEADRIGLVNRVLPHDELLPFVREYAEDLAANASPSSVRVMKRQIYEHMTESLGDAHADAVRLMVESFDRPDFREGVQSFLQKRPPKFDRV